VAVSNPLLLVGAATLNGAVGLGLFHLGLVRFWAFGRPLDLCVGLAFATLALANLGLRVLGPVAAVGLLRPPFEAHLLLLLLTQALAIVLFLVGVIDPDLVIEPVRRRAYALRVGGLLALGLAEGGSMILLAGDGLPGAVDPPGRALLEAGASIPDFLVGQAPWLLLTDGVLAGLLLLAALGYMQVAWRLGDPHLARVALALVPLSVGNLLTVPFPPVAYGYVSLADGLRLCAYGGLLAFIVAGLGHEFAAQASREERVRLSRELHDGLVQLLSLLHLRVSRAMSVDRPAEARARDLEAASRLVESALLEARQAITVLRTGTLSWQEFTRALDGFADAFANNHDVAVEVTTAADGPRVDAVLQAEILRLLQEAASNAVRHGAATRLEVALTPGGRQLQLTICDNGRGFDPGRAQARGGVGLTSMRERVQRRGGQFRIDSSPGQGARIEIQLALSE
jgi:signal transduction histidine kinase